MSLGDQLFHRRTWYGAWRVLAVVVVTLLVSTTLSLTTTEPASAFPPGVSWGSGEHRYRLPIDLESAPGGVDLVAVADVDFTVAFSDANAAGATFDPATLLVHEVDAAGVVVDSQIPFQFDPSTIYEPTTAATGELVIAMPGNTSPATQRHFVAYFEELGVATTPASVTPVVTVNATAFDEGLSTAHIATATTDWYYDLNGGGFSSVVDATGNDWVSYSSAVGSAGEFRGIPNLVYPDGYFHPGSNTSTTTIDTTGPLRASLTSTTVDGWEMQWEIFASHARGTVLQAPLAYWFLYEGTPGGALDAGDIVIRADGNVTNAGTSFTGDFVAEEWVAFADPGVGRSLYIANHVDDTAFDSYRDLNAEMTVFGWGRDHLTSELTGTNRSFSVGFTDAIDHAGVAPTVRSSLTPPTATVGVGEATSGVSGNNFVSDDFDDVVLSGQWNFIDPVGDASYQLNGAGTGDATVTLAVPGGTSHDAWTTNESVRLMQPIGDVDLAIETGFVTVPSQQYQSNGIIVEQDGSNYARFDVYHDGNNLQVFAAEISNGSPSVHISSVVPATTRFLELDRVGDTWTGWYSSDGTNWNLAGSFVFDLTASSAGVFAGNAGPDPAYSAVVDYVFNTANPIVPEDGSTSGTHTITTSTVGNGDVTTSPDQAVYLDGTVVQLTATPEPGQTFLGWTGDVTSANPVLDITVAGSDINLTASFTDTALYPIDAAVVGGGSVTKSPDAASYPDGSIVQLTATPAVGETFLGWTGDVTSANPVLDITLAGGPVNVTANFSLHLFISDDFDDPTLGSQWTLVDPVGDAVVSLTGSGTGNATVSLALPAGSAHDPWTPNDAARLVQPIADTDFTLEAGFDSVPAEQVQQNGIIVEQDADNWLRFDVYHDGDDLRVFAGVIANGSASSLLNSKAADGTRFLRLDRTGDTWTGSTSTDGVVWSEVGNFVFTMATTAAGVFAGNAGTSPAFVGTVDYIFNTASPITPEDNAHVVHLDAVGNGSVSQTPDQAGYFDGTTVQLTATPDVGETFIGWTGDVVSQDLVVDVTIAGASINATANFTETLSYTVDATTIGSGSVSIAPDQVDYLDGTFVQLTATPNPGETFLGWAGDITSPDPVLEFTIAGNPVQLTATFTGSGFVSDDFNTPELAGQWTFVDPRADSSVSTTGAGTGQATALIAVPTGNSHDPWSTNNAARIMQPIADVDVTFEAGFDSVPSSQFQQHGFIVEQDASNWVRFDLVHNGDDLRAFGARIAGGTPTALIDVIVPSDTRFLRLDRTNNTWTGSYSGDGINWTEAGSFIFAINTTSAGVFSGNAGPNPAFTSIVDYVFDMAHPVAFEDGAAASFPVNITTTGDGSVATSPDQSSYADGSVVQLTATPDAGETFIGWTGDVTSTNPIIDVTVSGGPVDVTAAFSQPSGSFSIDVIIDGSGSVVRSPDQSTYTDGSVVQLTTSPNVGETFIGWTGDVTSTNPVIDVTVTGDDINLTASFSQPFGFVSDDFDNVTLGSQWTFVDPVGDSSLMLSGAGSGQAIAQLALPAGTRHDAWRTNNSARLMQPVQDTDFGLEVGLLTAPDERYELNGLLVEQDSANWIRFDVYHDGSKLRAFGARTTNNKSAGQFAVAVPDDTQFLRLDRVGDTWTGQYSSDGANWTTAGSFTSVLTVTSAGVFAGNAGASPAYTADVDYIFDVASPIVPEDASSTSTYPVDVVVIGNGSVTKSPDQSQYVDGSIVQLTATPDAGQTFIGWTGDITSTNPTIDATITGAAINLTAEFSALASYPIDITVTGNGSVTKNPDQPDYLDGSVVQLTATPDAGQTFIGWTGDITSTNPTIDATITGAAINLTAEFSQPTAGFISDDFNATTLAAQWQVVDPIGDATVTLDGFNTGQATVSLALPAGVSHDAWDTNNAARLMQPINDGDLSLELGLLSAPSQRYEINGLIIEQDSANWVRFDVYHDGNKLRAFGAITINNDSQGQFATSVPANTQFLRLERVGSTWTGWYSTDGISWNQAGSFTHTLSATSAGVYAGNAGPSPAFTGIIDYVFDTNSPIVPEDVVISSHPVNVTLEGAGMVSRTPDQADYLDGTIVQLTATPDVGESFVGWTGDVTSSALTIDVTVSGAPINLTATFTDTPGAGFVSDDFNNAVLGGHWTFVDPIGDTTLTLAGTGTGQATASLDLPGGTRHDIWATSYDAPRLMQTIADHDFELEAGFVSAPSQQFQMNGIVVEQDASNWIRFEVYHDGTDAHVFGATTTANSSQSEFNVVVPATTRFLRLNRVGDSWTGLYSEDATSWTIAGSFSFAITTSAAGVYAANAGADPAFTGIVDYVFDTATPIVPEDGSAGSYPVNITVAGDGSVAKSPDQGSYLDGSVVQLTATPDTGETFIGWTGDVTSTNPVIDVTIAGADINVTASFTEPAEYSVGMTVVGQGAVAKSPDQTTYTDGSVVQLTATPDTGETFIGWTGDVTSTNPVIDVTIAGADINVTASFTDTPSPAGIDVWYGSTQTFGDDGISQRWVNILGHASDPDGIAALSYRLNGGAMVPLNVGSDLRRIYGDGDFNIDIDKDDLNVGANDVLIILQDGNGDVATETVNVIWAPTPVTTPFTVDWTTATSVTDGAQIVDGNWELDNGQLRTLESGYDRSVAIGDLSWENYEVEVPITVHSVTPGSGTPESGLPLIGMGLRWQGHSEIAGEQPHWGFYPTGAFAWYRLHASNNGISITGNGGSPQKKKGFTLNYGTTYIFKTRVETVAGGTEYKFKAWEQGTPEPATWRVEITEVSGPATGSVLLLAHHFDASFGNVTVTPLS